MIVNMSKDEITKFELLSETLKRMVRSAYFDSKKAIDLIYENAEYKKIGALAYLNKAVAQMSSAESLYFSNHDILCHNDIEDVFNTFNIFSDELIENFSTAHSQQSADIEFSNFEDALQSSVFAMERS